MEGMMIEVTVEPARKLVRARMGGLLTLDEVKRFSAEEQAAVRGMGLGSGEFLLLVETEGNVVQTQDVVQALQDLIQHSPLKAKRIATVRTSALATLQTRRLTTLRNDYEVFDSLADAEAWLFA
jgi:hypothetical protein